ncbi:hypothetical protein PENTCL1PPCAC_1278, partial [Pristionchus entomophagus]
ARADKVDRLVLFLLFYGSNYPMRFILFALCFLAVIALVFSTAAPDCYGYPDLLGCGSNTECETKFASKDVICDDWDPKIRRGCCADGHH